jgi:transposase
MWRTIMDKVVARMLRPWEGQKLRQMKRQLANAVNCRHGRIVLLSRGNTPNREIARLVGCTPQWVRTILHRFNRGGIEAISWYPYYCNRAGPRKFISDLTEQIAEVALASPKALIGMSVWSLPKLRDYLVAQKIVPGISVERLRQILRDRKVNWRHTQTWKESDDPNFWPKYRRIRRLYKGGRPPNGRRLSIDEFGPLNLLPRHGMHYARTGHVDRHRATYHRDGGVRYLYGVYDLERDTLRGRFVQRKNRRTFLSFLRWVRGQYSGTEILHIVLDNATFHDRPEVLAYAATHRIKFYFTPTSASWLNRIECHFAALKKFTLDNTDYRSHRDMQVAMHRYLRWRNGQRQISSRSWRTYRLRHADPSHARKAA